MTAQPELRGVMFGSRPESDRQTDLERLWDCVHFGQDEGSGGHVGPT